MTPEQRGLRSRMASHASWANTQDRTERTAPARRASPVSLDYWLAQYEDPAAARSAHKAHMTRLALRSSQARARRRGEVAGQ